MENSLSPYQIKSINSILRNTTRKEDERLNILGMGAHERYESQLSMVNADFYIFQVELSHKWNTQYAPMPSNYYILDRDKGEFQIPEWIDFDLVFCQAKDHYPALRHLSERLNIPLIVLEHTFPMPQWSSKELNDLKKMHGHANVFISESSRNAWGWGENEAIVINHGLDTELFQPSTEISRKNHILSICNDFVRRDWACGYTIWKDLVKNLPYKIVGKTPGLSEPAKSTEDLVEIYQESSIFLNTSLCSPIPMCLLEAMACGCAVVSTATCMIPEIIENGVNGYLSNDKKEMRKYLERLLENPDECRRLGENARNTILDKFSLSKFIENWDKLFRTVSKLEIGQL